MILNENNFLSFAMKHYNNPSCFSLKDFREDLRIFNKLIKNLDKENENIRLTLNFIIILFNLFDKAAINLIFFKIDKKHWETLITCLYFLGLMPEEIPEHGITLNSFSLNKDLLMTLQQL